MRIIRGNESISLKRTLRDNNKYKKNVPKSELH